MNIIKKTAAALACIMAISSVGLSTVNAENFISGDVNSDGVADSSDATQILIYYANSLLENSGSINFNTADVNKDGTVDSSDATVILICYAENLLGNNYSCDDIIEKINNGDYTNKESLYDNIIKEYKDSKSEYENDLNSESECYINHILFDIDHDGTKELIVKCGKSTGSMNFRIYTIRNNEVVKCKYESFFDQGESYYKNDSYRDYWLDGYITYDENGNLYFVSSHVGDTMWAKVNLNGTNVFYSDEGEAGIDIDGEHCSPGDPRIPGTEF